MATRQGDHLEFGTFPRDLTTPGLIVYVPNARYMLALKLKAISVTDPARGEQERRDIVNLMRVVGVRIVRILATRHEIRRIAVRVRTREDGKPT